MAVSQIEFGAAMVIGIGPALAVLFWSLRRFDRPHVDYTLFDDRRVFFGLAVGMVFGVVIQYLDLFAGGLDIVSALSFFLAILFFDELFKSVYLNRKGYRGRFDTTFYGVAVGVGAASTQVVGSVVYSVSSLYAVQTAFLLVVLSASECLIQADTGAVIGFGATRGDLWTALARAVGIRYLHFGLLFAYVLAGGGAEDPLIIALAIVSLLTSLAFAAIVYHYVYNHLLPDTIPDDIRRGIKRARRARALKE